MSLVGRILILVLLLGVSSGCVTRTYESRTGKSAEKKTLWFWQEDYRQP